MVRSPKMSATVVSVLEVFLRDPDTARYGLELGASTGLASGTIHPILARLEGAGWLRSEWEAIDPASAGRPRRRFYSLTASGAEEARSALATVAARRAKLARRLGPTGGTSPLPGTV